MQLRKGLWRFSRVIRLGDNKACYPNLLHIKNSLDKSLETTNSFKMGQLRDKVVFFPRLEDNGTQDVRSVRI